MITKRVRGKKNPVTIVSSSYFEDIKMIDEGMRETNLQTTFQDGNVQKETRCAILGNWNLQMLY